jgi:hypothetical protein
MPLGELRRCCTSDLDERPVSNECERNFPVRQRTARNEMIVAMHQNSHHGDLMPPGEDREPDNR